jgi:hypothetical protein
MFPFWGSPHIQLDGNDPAGFPLAVTRHAAMILGGFDMSDLIIIGYDNHDEATAAYNEVNGMQGDFVVQLQGLAIVTVDAEGKSHVETPQKIVGVSAAGGALWGMLLKTSLSEDDEKELAHDLDTSRAVRRCPRAAVCGRSASGRRRPHRGRKPGLRSGSRADRH